MEKNSITKVFKRLLLCYLRYYTSKLIRFTKFEKFTMEAYADYEDDYCSVCIANKDEGLIMSKYVKEAVSKIASVRQSLNKLKKINLFNIIKILSDIDYVNLLAPTMLEVWIEYIKYTKKSKPDIDDDYYEALIHSLAYRYYGVLINSSTDYRVRDLDGNMKDELFNERHFDYLFYGYDNCGRYIDNI